MKAVFFEIPVPPVLKLTDLLKGPDGELKQLVPFTEGGSPGSSPGETVVAAPQVLVLGNVFRQLQQTRLIMFAPTPVSEFLKIEWR